MVLERRRKGSQQAIHFDTEKTEAVLLQGKDSELKGQI
jgi:hypothetical protein